jgi:hypothetical protein
MENESTKRPKLVWVITLFYILSAGWTLLSFSLIYSGAIPINKAQEVYFGSQTTIDTMLTLAMVSLNTLGAIFLFLLRRHALHFFLSAFSIGLLMTVYHILFKNWLGAIDRPGLVGALTGWIISISIIFYTYKLIKREILK